MLVQLTMRRTAGHAPPNSPIDGIRIMALLPRRWRADLTQATGDIIIRVQTDEDVTGAEIGAEMAEILTNPEVSHWRLAACRTLSGPPDAKPPDAKPPDAKPPDSKPPVQHEKEEHR
ncbi:hypothetical protein [Microbispora sp. ATCC PTA-5024]|uniref:hypothetical protein n=1 Tax=Microbispora sp. ATCC PTA-5024 TaxID=316330 RepID=UPI00041C96FB|nr:hypothetical protein [Microbispora sp. ATCC PTA-5024]